MDRIWRDDVLREAWRRVKRNRGSAGVDSETLAEIEQRGVESFLGELGSVLRAGTYRPQPVLRRYIPKAERPWGSFACAARFGIRGQCMLRPEVHLVSRVREIRMHGLNGGLALSRSVSPTGTK